MHELSIVENVLEIVERNLVERGFTRLTGVMMRVGLFAAVDEEALRFAFEVFTGGGPHQGAVLEVEKTFPSAQCSCGTSFEVDDLIYTCPRCDSYRWLIPINC